MKIWSWINFSPESDTGCLVKLSFSLNVWEGLIWFSYECVFPKQLAVAVAHMLKPVHASSSELIVPIYFQFWLFEIGRIGSTDKPWKSVDYTNQQTLLSSPPESWLLNICPHILDC